MMTERGRVEVPDPQIQTTVPPRSEGTALRGMGHDPDPRPHPVPCSGKFRY